MEKGSLEVFLVHQTLLAQRNSGTRVLYELLRLLISGTILDIQQASK
jgi:hypothetical protein